ncbi:acyl-CoA thioester hydrolase [Pseudobutyrivibrio sp. YE44]|uniref:acyl-CoA thioesterase n=1 Tax=Pseudobutyrivibrio sp. YE44 TaxID=1520802 RepID=UPI00088617B4|nr:thioesterase family protein [Pseudobutyrivibrio sp. YE44]SDB57375.1 acyl-CoA thioester hydrolase [Pseudobutyrivibrio sp. YE44]
MKYKHVVQYYETDKMGITHHSNYIRWMEEARINFLSNIGWDYSKLETLGIVSPVIKVDCDYKRTTTFADQIDIYVKVVEFKGVKLKIYYEMKNHEGEIVCEGTTSHAFLSRDGKPLRLKQSFPEFYNCLMEIVSGK